MRKILAIAVCKIVRFIGKLVHRGSSLPGQIALKIDPDILRKVKLPKYVIAVTGSNGKTSTVEMIHEVLKDAGMSVAYNEEGSNQIEGVTTFILENTTLSGRFKKDVILIESDERYARLTFKYFSPTHYIITNLYRDQLTRNGHPEWIYNIIKDSIHESPVLLLNADDPLISLYGEELGNKCIYFGVERYHDSVTENDSVYNDMLYCPKCHQKMTYDYYHFNHVGKYHCPACGYERHEPDYKVTDIDLNEGYAVIENSCRINLALRSIYNIYNILATYSVSRLIGIDETVIANALNNYILKNGRVQQFTLGDHEGTLLISKHENSISYNQSLRVVKNEKQDVSVMVMVDAISRKYFTSETSWLWDIDFEFLQSSNVKKIVLTGLYASDLAERILYAGVDMDNVHIEKDIPEAMRYLKENAVGHIYVLTCFSDQNKFMSRVGEI